MAIPTSQPTSLPTSLPTSAPTVYVLVIPQTVVVIGILALVGCFCFAICCCRKAEGYKKKIYYMLEEAKIDVAKETLAKHSGDDDSEDEDDESIIQASVSSGNKKR